VKRRTDRIVNTNIYPVCWPRGLFSLLWPDVRFQIVSSLRHWTQTHRRRILPVHVLRAWLRLVP